MAGAKNPKKTIVQRLECCASGDALFDAIEHALEGREHVVMVRVNDQILEQLDMLVEAGICKSRSSAATFMIREGIKANAALFDKVGDATKKIAELKSSLREVIGDVAGSETEDG